MLGRGEVAFPFKFASFSHSVIGTRVFPCKEHCVPSLKLSRAKRVTARGVLLYLLRLNIEES